MDKPQSKAEKATRTTMDTICFTPDTVRSWKNPPFQRPIKINAKVREMAEGLKTSGGVLPGVITLGYLKNEKLPYKVDGQHRLEGFLLTELPLGYADVRNCFFDDMAEMGEEFIKLQSSLVTMKPDDVLRALEATSTALSRIRAACPYVGYSMIRRGPGSPIISMSALLRDWSASEREVPSCTTSSQQLARDLDDVSASNLCRFLKQAVTAWGKDLEYSRMWGALNLSICMWIYRRTVLATFSPRVIRMDDDAFCRCLIALSADRGYYDWLQSRQLTQNDRSPAYGRIKAIFQRRLKEDTGRLYVMPQPMWTH